MSRPDIKQPAQLKGKKVGVTRLGGSTDWALDAATKQWGIERGRRSDRDSNRRHARRFGGACIRRPRRCGAVAAEQFPRDKAGMHELVDVGQLGIVFPNTPLSTTRNFIKSNRDTALRFLRGFSQGLNRLRTDKEFSMKVLSKYTKVTDPETLAQLHQTYGVRYSGDRIPYVRAEGIDEILKRTPGKEAREAKAGEFIDNSLLKELEQNGWFRSQGR